MSILLIPGILTLVFGFLAYHVALKKSIYDRPKKAVARSAEQNKKTFSDPVAHRHVTPEPFVHTDSVF